MTDLDQLSKRLKNFDTTYVPNKKEDEGYDSNEADAERVRVNPQYDKFQTKHEWDQRALTPDPNPDPVHNQAEADTARMDHNPHYKDWQFKDIEEDRTQITNPDEIKRLINKFEGTKAGEYLKQAEDGKYRVFRVKNNLGGRHIEIRPVEDSKIDENDLIRINYNPHYKTSADIDPSAELDSFEAAQKYNPHYNKFINQKIVYDQDLNKYTIDPDGNVSAAQVLDAINDMSPAEKQQLSNETMKYLKEHPNVAGDILEETKQSVVTPDKIPGGADVGRMAIGAAVSSSVFQGLNTIKGLGAQALSGAQGLLTTLAATGIAIPAITGAGLVAILAGLTCTGLGMFGKGPFKNWDFLLVGKERRLTRAKEYEKIFKKAKKDGDMKKYIKYRRKANKLANKYGVFFSKLSARLNNVIYL